MFERLIRRPLNAARLLNAHFAPTLPPKLTILERTFPGRMRADLQLALNEFLQTTTGLQGPFGLPSERFGKAATLRSLGVEDDAPAALAPEYEDVDVGDEAPVRCIKKAFWFFHTPRGKAAVMVAAVRDFQNQVSGVNVQLATEASSASVADDFFRQLEKAIQQARSYRGKVLSLEQTQAYSGASSGVTVHRLRSVSQEEVILPPRTLALLERNVLGFMKIREQLRAAKQSTRKGLLFYGPPGTGKTHTIHYLAGVLKGHTTLIITAQQVGLLGEYMALARLLQPSIVVIEDADLIARERQKMESVGAELMLNKLLNEMDGLKEDADILFILTTNRPETLEEALVGRPGRIDQAIEFPLPDADGRRKLAKLYAGQSTLSPALEDEVVKRTDGVSASFIKELLRRAHQMRLEREGATELSHGDFDEALNEILFAGGSLNVKLLGGRVGA